MDHLSGIDEVLTVESIRRRAPLLGATSEGLKAQLRELASASCGVFMESADCVKLVHSELSHLTHHLRALESHLPLTAVRVEAEASIAERQHNAALLSKHAEVLEVLERPQLMDTCVRNGFIEEALELEATARSRAAVHSEVPAIVQVAHEVAAHMADLRDSLLAQLAGPLQLPDALRIVSYLCRMGAHALTEPELRIAFLRNRTLFFVQAEAALPRESAASFLLKYVDLCRVHWYDTATHYRAVFATGEDLSSVAKVTCLTPGPTCKQWVHCPAGASAGDAIATIDADGVTHVLTMLPLCAGECAFEAELPCELTWGEPPNELAPGELAQADRLGGLLLANWAAERVGDFSQTLTTWLPRVQEGAFLANLIEQCTYSAKSLARVGLDFSALVRAPFRDEVLRLLDEGLAAAIDHWSDAIAAHRWNAPHASAAAIAALTPTGGSASATNEPAAEKGGSRTSSRPPPLALLQHLPVAVLLNHMLGVLNELRPCAPYELRRPFFARVRGTLLSCVRALAEVEEGGAFSEQARTHFRSLCACMAEHMLPHLAACTDQLVPVWMAPPEVSTAGVTASGDGEVALLVDAVRERLLPLCADPGREEEAAPAAGAVSSI